MAIFGYLRVSTALQASEGESLETQFRQIESYATIKGFSIPKQNFITEKGVSGSLEFEKRPEGGRLFQILQRSDVLIFSKLDRAFRNTRNALNTLHDLKQRGVSVHFIDLGGDVTNDGIGSVIFTILSAFATFERERIATRIREVKQTQKSEGKFLGGIPRFGYQVVDSKLEKDPTGQLVLRQIRGFRRKGMSYRKIAEQIEQNYSVRLSHTTIASLLIGVKTKKPLISPCIVS